MAMTAAALAAGLAGCATAPEPGTIEEQIWFDKATGPDIENVPPLLRFYGIVGYPRTDGRGYRPLPPDTER